MIDLLRCSDQHKFQTGQYLHYVHRISRCREIPKCSIKFRRQLQHINIIIMIREGVQEKGAYFLREIFKRPHETEHQFLLLHSVIIYRVDLFGDQVLRVKTRARPIEDIELHDGLARLRHHPTHIHFFLFIKLILALN